ncbi:MAG: hypothetical protein AAGA77_16140 [Bacteroidota bacterium]
MNWLRNVHLVFGFVMFITFLLTGQYMDRNFDHLSNMDDLPRALMRAQHLYILLSALINIVLGSYLTISKDKLVKTFQIFGSLLIISATLLLTYSFFNELPTDHIERPLCRLALYIMLAGALGHGFPNLLLLFVKKSN